MLARYGLELARHLRRMVRDDDVAEDLLQETFLRAYRALGTLGEGANERAWLYRIATNAALNHIRGRARERRAMERAGHEHAVHAAAGYDGGEQGERREALWMAVAKLPERQRVAITLKVADELDYDEIAARMGCTVATARANVYQATKRLKVKVR